MFKGSCHTGECQIKGNILDEHHCLAQLVPRPATRSTIVSTGDVGRHRAHLGRRLPAGGLLRVSVGRCHRHHAEALARVAHLVLGLGAKAGDHLFFLFGAILGYNFAWSLGMAGKLTELGNAVDGEGNRLVLLLLTLIAGG